MPVVSGVFPHAGGAFSLVLIEGDHFNGAQGVEFGTQPTYFLTLSRHMIIAIAPPFGSKGQVVDVTVTTSAGTSAKSSADTFKYEWAFNFSNAF